MFLYTFRASRDPKHSKLHSFNCLAGCFNGGVVRIISDIRLKHGPNAVNLDNCGKFVLADDLSGLADISHIDLSNIGSLEGTCRASLSRVISTTPPLTSSATFPCGAVYGASRVLAMVIYLLIFVYAVG